MGQCTDSLYLAKDPSISSEVLMIVQQCDDDHAACIELMRKEHGFSVLILNKNIGISRAINLFAAGSRGEFLCLVTSDCLATKGFDRDALGKMSKDKAVCQVFPIADKSENPIHMRRACQPFGSLEVDPPGGAPLDAISAELNIRFYRKSLFDAIGFYDERWKACYEERDFSLRAFLAGWRTIMSFDSYVWHCHNMTTKNGAINFAYEGYIEMPTLDHAVLKAMWDKKWPNLSSFIPSLVASDFSGGVASFPGLSEAFKNNVWLPYIQDISY